MEYSNTTLVLSVTKRCNMRCPNCVWLLEDDGFFEKNDMPFEKATEILEYYRERGLKSAILQGEGEVFLYPHFRRILSHFLGAGVKLNSLTTNGLMLNEFLDITDKIKLQLAQMDMMLIAI